MSCVARINGLGRQEAPSVRLWGTGIGIRMVDTTGSAVNTLIVLLAAVWPVFIVGVLEHRTDKLYSGASSPPGLAP